MQIDRLLAFHQNPQTSGGTWSEDGIQADPIETQLCMDQDWSNGEVPPPMPTGAIVMGDFNSQPGSDEYTRMVGDIDPSYGRVEYLDGFVDSWTAADDQFGERITWLPNPPERSPGHGLTLDYCFVDAELGRKVKRAWVDNSVEGSDHRPYWVELDL